MNPRGGGFSLLEVVLAVGIFATAIVAVVGLSSPLQRNVGEILDQRVASRLARSIQQELDAIGFDRAVQITEVNPTIRFVANADASRVRLVFPDAPANNRLDDPDLPGIANRDRHFLVTMRRQYIYSELTSGSLTLIARVEWPYMRPEGPANPAATAYDQDPADEVLPASQRRVLNFFFSLPP